MKITISKQTLQRIADEIRILLKSTDTYKPKEFADAIASVTSIYNYQPVGTLKISHNGLYNVANYDKINVQVRKNEEYNPELLEKTGVPWIEPTPQNYEVNIIKRNNTTSKNIYLLPKEKQNEWSNGFCGQELAIYGDLNNIYNLYDTYTEGTLCASPTGEPYKIKYNQSHGDQQETKVTKIPVKKQIVQIAFTKTKITPYQDGEYFNLNDYQVKAFYNYGRPEDITRLCTYNIPQFYTFTPESESTITAEYIYDNNIYTTSTQRIIIITGKCIFESGWSTYCDIDSHIFLLDQTGKCPNTDYYIYYGHSTLSIDGKTIAQLPKDDTSGGGSQGAILQQPWIDLESLPKEIKKIVLGINIYSGATTFSTVLNLFTKVVNSETNQTIFYYDLTSQAAPYTAMEVATIERTRVGWRYSLNPIGYIGTTGQSGTATIAMRAKFGV